jgi:hypothetical protein
MTAHILARICCDSTRRDDNNARLSTNLRSRLCENSIFGKQTHRLSRLLQSRTYSDRVATDTLHSPSRSPFDAVLFMAMYD